MKRINFWHGEGFKYLQLVSETKFYKIFFFTSTKLISFSEIVFKNEILQSRNFSSEQMFVDSKSPGTPKWVLSRHVPAKKGLALAAPSGRQMSLKNDQICLLSFNFSHDNKNGIFSSLSWITYKHKCLYMVV